MTTMIAEAESVAPDAGFPAEEAITGQNNQLAGAPGRNSGSGTRFAVAALVVLALFGGLVWYGGGFAPGGSSPYDRLHKSFQKKPTPAEIEAIMKPVLEAFGLPGDPPAVKAAGETLTKAGKAYGAAEIDILYCMEGRGAHLKGLESFASVAEGCGFLVQTLGPGAGKR